MNKLNILKNKHLIFSILLLTSINATAQTRVGDFGLADYKFNKLNKKTLNRFTGKTTKFILPSFYPLSSFENILNEVWDATPFVLVSEDDFDDSSVKVDDALAQFMNIEITKPKTTITKVGSTGIIAYTSDMDGDYSFHVLNFHVVDKFNKKPKEDDIKWYSSTIATIYFTPDISIRQQAGANTKVFKSDLLNFRLGYFKNFLQFVNNSIKNDISSNLYDDYSKSELKNLKSKTLYIDENFIYSYNALSIKEKDAPKIVELTEDYSFESKVVNYDEIERMILNNKSPEFYYLVYNQINSNKIITIINGNTGDIIYQQHSLMSYNIESKDFKELDKQIKKIK